MTVSAHAPGPRYVQCLAVQFCDSAGVSALARLAMAAEREHVVVHMAASEPVERGCSSSPISPSCWPTDPDAAASAQPTVGRLTGAYLPGAAHNARVASEAPRSRPGGALSHSRHFRTQTAH